MNREVRHLAIVVLLAVSVIGTGFAEELDSAPKEAAGKPSILFIRLDRGITRGEPFMREYARNLVKDGYTVGVRDMEFKTHNWKGDVESDDIDKYDIICFLDPPFWDNNTKKHTPEFMALWEKILSHVDRGGGLLFCPWVNGPWRASANLLLRPLGLTVINGVVYSDEVVIATSKGINFARTANLSRHPVTEQVKQIWYPVQNHDFAYEPTSVPFHADSNWEVIVRGETNSRAKPHKFDIPEVDNAVPEAMNTIKDSVPIMAVRKYGKGRIAFIGIQAHYHINGGLAPAYENIVMGRGLDDRPSDMPRLLTNLFDWLGEPARTDNLFTGAKTDSKRIAPVTFVAPPPLDLRQHAYPSPMKEFKGVIGARTTYSTGKSTPDEYVAAARKAGLDFLVILEDFENISEARFQELQKECKKFNSDEFLVFVGLTFGDEYDNSFFAFRPDLGFPQPGLLKEGTKKFGTRTRESSFHFPLIDFFLNNGFNQLFLGHYRPEKGKGVPFWDIRGGRNSLAVWTYINGKLVDDMSEEFAVVSDSCEWPIGMALTLIDDAGAIKDIADGKMAHTVMLAHQLKDLWDKPGEPGDFNPVGYPTQGPEINTWQYAGPRDYVADGNWFDWTRYIWKIRMKVSSASGIREIKVMDGVDLFRRYLPQGAKTFEQEIVLSHNQQHHLFLIVTDANGKRALSDNLIDRNHIFQLYYCGDRVNTLGYSATVAEDSPWGSTAGNYPLATMPKGPLSESVRLDINLDQVRFSGFDGQPDGGSWIWPRPIVITDQGVEGGAINRQIKVPMACADVVIQESVISHKFPKGLEFPNGWSGLGPLIDQEIFKGTLRYTTFFHPGHVPAPVLVEGDFEILQDLTFDPKHKFHFSVAIVKASRESAGYKAGAVQHTTGREHAFLLDYRGEQKQKYAYGTLQPGGYVYFYPSVFGPFGVFSLDSGMDYEYNSQVSAFQLGYNFKDKTFKKGDHFRYRYIAFTSAHDDKPSLEVPEAFRDLLGLDGEPGYRVTLRSGRIVDQKYILRIDGEGKGFAGSIVLPKGKELPTVLPVMVENLNPRWTALLYEEKTNRARPLGMLKDAAYAHLTPTDIALEFFIGHPFTCDQPEVFMTAVQTGENRWDLSFNNPTDKDVVVNAERSQWFGMVPMQPIRANVPAGATVKIEVE